MSKGAVLVDWRDNVALLTLNRPERRNAVDLESLLLIREAQVEAEKRKIRALVLTGTAPAFCAGADLAGVREDVFHETLNEVLRGFTQLPCVLMVRHLARERNLLLPAMCELQHQQVSSVFPLRNWV